MARKKPDTSTFEGRIKKQGYHKVGSHSAAKLCKYSRDSILGKNLCYKNKFYGIRSHQCLQCSPVLQFCNLSCKFCWRIMPELNNSKSGQPASPATLHASSQKNRQASPAAQFAGSQNSSAASACSSSGWLPLPKNFSWDEPQLIADGLIAEQKRIMSGFRGNEKADKNRAKEAMEPKHVALSLIGEPALYPKLSKLLEIFHKKGMTTFLVTNGTLPEAIKNLNPLPTQLYVSLVAPDGKTHAKVTQASSEAAKKNWQNYLKSLELLNFLSKKTRTVLRMTVAHGLNDQNPQGFANLILLSQAHYIEVKSMVYVGWARNKERGLRLEDMYSMDEIRAYAKNLAAATGYIYEDEHLPSRIVLLCKDEAARNSRILSF
ncbi:MAG: radical SAM protein [Candidatus Micrarchaeota archaeon]